jgi:hypothetical protein
MGTHDQKQIVSSEKTLFSSVRRLQNRPTPFVFQWRALQHQFKKARLDCFSTGISEIVAFPRSNSLKTDAAAPQFQKSLLSNLIAS